jgi:hypothetical protein
MRDYAQYFFTGDSVPYVGPNRVYLYYFFATKAACDQFVIDNPVSPGGGVLSPTAPIWFRLDKTMLLQWIAGAAPVNLGTATSPIFSGKKQMIYFESPRKIGVNSFVEKRVKAGPGDSSAQESDFSGADGLITFLNSLPALADQLEADGQVRQAGIVRYAYNQVIANKWTITEMLAYLRDNRIGYP